MSQDGEKIVVALVISNMEYGGAQRQIVELVNHSDIRRFEFHLISLSSYVPIAKSIKNNCCQLHIVEKKGKYDLSVAFRLANLLRQIGAHIVHGYLFDAEIAARLAGRLAGTSSVGGSERNTGYKIKRIQRIVYYLTRPLMDFCIANSQSGAVFNRQELGIAARKYYTVHNGVNTDRFQPQDRQEARERLAIEGDGFIVGIFGSLKVQKNHPMMLDAFEQHLRQHPNSRLLIVGDQLAGGLHGSDQYAQEIHERIATSAFRDRCILLGNQDKVENVYPACNVTALPSLFEGTPNVALESMACGVPVIASNVSDNSLIIADGKTGYLVRQNDAATMTMRLDELASCPDQCAEFGHAARRSMIQHFSCERLAEKTAAVYLDTLGQSVVDTRPLRSFN